MRTHVCRLSVVALVLVLFLPDQATAEWTRLKTENFLFVGDAAERQIREVAQHLEQFRHVMSGVLPPAAVASSVPTIVFVFQTDKSLTPYKPRFEGRPVEVEGYFLARRDANYVTMNVELEQASLSVIFHEYAHFLVRNTAGDMPLWANEGLAGVYETFEERSDGRGAIIGMPQKDRLALLKNSTLMPLGELIAVDHSSPVYNEGNRRAVFYAESWALMHYLMLGNQVRAGQLREYLAHVKDGVTPEEAFKGAFGGDLDGLERELREYIRNFLFPVLRVNFTEKVTGVVVGRGNAMDDVDANAYLGDLLSMLDRVDEARAQLKKLVEANPKSARAVSTLGLLELRANKVDDALPLLEQAAALDPTDSAVQRAWGRALHARSQEQAADDDPDATATLQKARTVLNRAVELSPRDADTLAMLGRLESNAADHARATLLFERAVSAAPGEERYRLMLADSLVWQQEYTRATTYLGPLVASSNNPEIKESARNLLAFVGRQRAWTEGAASPTGDGSDAAPAVGPLWSGPQTATGGRFVPALRPVGAGERRVSGMFTEVDCRPGSILLIIEAEGETLRIATEDLAKVDFITYRITAPGTVGCGPVRPASRVFATFKADAAPSAVSGVDGHALAIELLPDDFTPR